MKNSTLNYRQKIMPTIDCGLMINNFMFCDRAGLTSQGASRQKQIYHIYEPATHNYKLLFSEDTMATDEYKCFV